MKMTKTKVISELQNAVCSPKSIELAMFLGTDILGQTFIIT